MTFRWIAVHHYQILKKSDSDEFFIQELKPKLNTQSDSIKAKLFSS